MGLDIKVLGGIRGAEESSDREVDFGIYRLLHGFSCVNRHLRLYYWEILMQGGIPLRLTIGSLMALALHYPRK